MPTNKNVGWDGIYPLDRVITEIAKRLDKVKAPKHQVGIQFFQVGNEPEKVLDSNSSTIWHTRYTPEIAPLPHYIQLDSRFLFFMQSLSSYKVSGHSGVRSLK